MGNLSDAFNRYTQRAYSILQKAKGDRVAGSKYYDRVEYIDKHGAKKYRYRYGPVKGVGNVRHNDAQIGMDIGPTQQRMDVPTGHAGGKPKQPALVVRTQPKGTQMSMIDPVASPQTSMDMAPKEVSVAKPTIQPLMQRVTEALTSVGIKPNQYKGVLNTFGLEFTGTKSFKNAADHVAYRQGVDRAALESIRDVLTEFGKHYITSYNALDSLYDDAIESVTKLGSAPVQAKIQAVLDKQEFARIAVDVWNTLHPSDPFEDDRELLTDAQRADLQTLATKPAPTASERVDVIPLLNGAINSDPVADSATPNAIHQIRRDDRIGGESVVTAIKPWSKGGADHRVYVETNTRHKGVVYLSGNHWNPAGKIEGNLTAQEWNEVLFRGIKDGAWVQVYGVERK